MYKLLQIIFVFLFVIIILNMPDNDVMLDKLHLKYLIIKRQNINSLSKKYPRNKKEEQSICNVLLKKKPSNIDDLLKKLSKINLISNINNNFNQEKIFAFHISIPNIENISIKFKNHFINQIAFSKTLHEVTFSKSKNLQNLINKSVAKPSKTKLFSKENSLMMQKQNNLIKNLIAKNDFHSNKIKQNYREIQPFEKKYISLNIYDHLDKKTKKNSNVYKINDDIAITTFKSHVFNNYSFNIRQNNFLKNDFLLNAISKANQYQNKNTLSKKFVKQILDLPNKNAFPMSLNSQKKEIANNLHLKDLIAQNEIIKKTKVSNNCSTKKAHSLSYVEALLKRPTLNLNDLIENVLKRNPDLKATKRRIEANALVIPRVQTLDDPELTIMRHDTPLQSNSDFFSKMRYEISQVFPFPGKLRLKGQIAEQLLKFAKSEEITTKRELILQTKRLYYQLYLNYEALRINKQNQDIISRFIEDTLALYKTGEEKYDEVLKAQVELQLLKKELLELLSDHDFIVSMINALLDCPQNNIIGKPQKLFTKNVNYKYQELMPIAIKNRSELQGIRSLICEQCFKAKLARKNYFPDFKVSGRYESKLGSKDAAWGAAIGINIPIWIQQKQKKQMLEAKRNAKAFQNDLKAFEAKIRGRIKDLLSKIESTDEKIDLYETGLIPKTSEALLSGEALYKTGKGDFLVLLDTIRQFQNFELEYEAQRAQREILFAELERAIGVSLEDIRCSTKN